MLLGVLFATLVVGGDDPLPLCTHLQLAYVMRGGAAWVRQSTEQHAEDDGGWPPHLDAPITRCPLMLARYNCEGTSYVPGSWQLRLRHSPRDCAIPSLASLASTGLASGNASLPADKDELNAHPRSVILLGDSYLRQQYETLVCAWLRAGVLQDVEVEVDGTIVTREADRGEMPACHGVLSATLGTFFGVAPGTRPAVLPPKAGSVCQDASWRRPLCARSTGGALRVCYWQLRSVKETRRALAWRLMRAFRELAPVATLVFNTFAMRQLGEDGWKDMRHQLRGDGWLRARDDGAPGVRLLLSPGFGRGTRTARARHVLQLSVAMPNPQVLRKHRLAFGHEVAHAHAGAALTAIGSALEASRRADAKAAIYPMEGLARDTNTWTPCRKSQEDVSIDNCSSYPTVRVCREPVPHAQCGSDPHICFDGEVLQWISVLTFTAALL
jgi:hypothetical protein